MRHTLRGLLMPFFLIVGGLSVGVATAPAGAAGTNLLTETFTNSATTSPGWQMPTGSSGVCLTAGSNMSASPIPDCAGTTPDSSGNGALQLTNNAGGQV